MSYYLCHECGCTNGHYTNCPNYDEERKSDWHDDWRDAIDEVMKGESE